MGWALSADDVTTIVDIIKFYSTRMRLPDFSVDFSFVCTTQNNFPAKQWNCDWYETIIIIHFKNPYIHVSLLECIKFASKIFVNSSLYTAFCLYCTVCTQHCHS